MIKKYEIKATWFEDASVTVEVNDEVFTEELATLINEFWGSADSRLDDEDGDVRRAVIRLFGAVAIRHYMDDGGADFNPRDASYTDKILRDEEGWPSSAEYLGIKITSVSVRVPEFDDCEVEEI